MRDEQLLRYSRHVMLPQLDVAGQERLLAARVLIVGLGGLGCPVAMYLAAAGVGTLVLADNDVVDLGNLQRQIAHGTADIGRNKAESAAVTVHNLNPDTMVEVHAARMSGVLLDTVLQGCDAVVDCCDNFATRFELNSAAVRHRVPLISGAAIRMEGQVSVFDARVSGSPCYRCLYEESDELDESCASNGVLAPLVGLVGSIQATECIKVLTGLGNSLSGRLLLIDACTMQIRELQLKMNPRCPLHQGTSGNPH